MRKSFSLFVFIPALAVALLCASCRPPRMQSAGIRRAKGGPGRGGSGRGGRGGPPGGMPPVPVSVAVADQESVPIELRAVGTVEPSITVQVKSQIAGELFKVDFVEGADVKKGDLLFEIDPRPYQEALRQAEAAVGRDQALKQQAEANLARDTAQSKFAESDAARNEQLLKDRITSRSAYEQSKANSDALGGSIQADRAAIESAQATLESDRCRG